MPAPVRAGTYLWWKAGVHPVESAQQGGAAEGALGPARFGVPEIPQEPTDARLRVEQAPVRWREKEVFFFPDINVT